jgi:Zn-dependent protease with chaperone function
VTTPSDAGLQALYFDGRSARGQAVHMLVLDGHLCLTPQASALKEAPAEVPTEAPTETQADPAHLRWPIDAVQWPETTRHGQRVLHLRGGGSLQAVDAAAFDAWRAALLRSGMPLGAGARDSWMVHAQQNWRMAAGAALLLVVLVVAGWRWGVPFAASGVLAVLPTSVDKTVGDAAYKSIQDRWLGPSTVPAARQAELRAAFARVVAAAYPQNAAQAAPAWQLNFAAADKDIGPNAFALPGGAMILTDAMVDLLKGQDDALMGVLAHELGHVRHRHGMRAFVQVGLVSAVASLVLGDFSSVLAAAPALVAQMAYSRDAEREADTESVRLMRASGRPPGAMVLLFERLKAAVPNRVVLPIALSSHPADEERLKFFRDADAGR